MSFVDNVSYLRYLRQASVGKFHFVKIPDPGETARNGFVRGKEHLKGMEKRDDESVLIQHVREWHQSDFATPPCHQFKMSVTQCHDTPLDRLVTEAVKISQSTQPVMNRKRGYRVNNVLSLSELSDVTTC